MGESHCLTWIIASMLLVCACGLESITTKGGNITIVASGDVYVVRRNASLPDTVVLGGDLSTAVYALTQRLQTDASASANANTALQQALGAVSSQVPVVAQQTLSTATQALTTQLSQQAVTLSALFSTGLDAVRASAALATSDVSARVGSVATITTQLSQGAVAIAQTASMAVAGVVQTATSIATTQSATTVALNTQMSQQAVSLAQTASVATAGVAATVTALSTQQAATNAQFSATDASQATVASSQSTAIGNLNQLLVNVGASVAAVQSAAYARTDALSAATVATAAALATSISQAASSSVAQSNSLATVLSAQAAAQIVTDTSLQSQITAIVTNYGLSAATVALSAQVTSVNNNLNQISSATATLNAHDLQMSAANQQLSAQVVAQSTRIASLSSALTAVQLQATSLSAAVQLMPLQSCMDVLRMNPAAASGIYSIRPIGYPYFFNVYCEMTIDGGGWTRVGIVDEAYATANSLAVSINEVPFGTFIDAASLRQASFMASWYVTQTPKQLLFHNLTPNLSGVDNGYNRKLRVTFGATRPTIYSFNNVALADCTDITSTPVTFANCLYASHQGSPWQYCSFSLTWNGVTNGFTGNMDYRLMLGPTSQPGQGCYFYNFDGNLIATNSANTFYAQPNKMLYIYFR